MHKHRDPVAKVITEAFLASQRVYLIADHPGIPLEQLQKMTPKHPLMEGITEALDGKPEKLAVELSQLTPQQLDGVTVWVEEASKGNYPEDQWQAVGDKVFDVFRLGLQALGERMRPEFGNPETPPEVLGYFSRSLFRHENGGVSPELTQKMFSEFQAREEALGSISPPSDAAFIEAGEDTTRLLPQEKRQKLRESIIDGGVRVAQSELSGNAFVEYCMKNSPRRGPSPNVLVNLDDDGIFMLTCEINPLFRFQRNVWKLMRDNARNITSIEFGRYERVRAVLDEDFGVEDAAPHMRHFTMLKPYAHYPTVSIDRSDFGGDFGLLQNLHYEVASAVTREDDAKTLEHSITPLAKALRKHGSNLRHPKENQWYPSNEDLTWLDENTLLFARMALAHAKP